MHSIRGSTHFGVFRTSVYKITTPGVFSLCKMQGKLYIFRAKPRPELFFAIVILLCWVDLCGEKVRVKARFCGVFVACEGVYAYNNVPASKANISREVLRRQPTPCTRHAVCVRSVNAQKDILVSSMCGSACVDVLCFYLIQSV